ncbi:hypothetical protein V0288_18060 [Pannus brasiliensis CCIBt3594]|uniref:Uncharacterized protein n=1 Tax=Pannus brasiliensis CCIBt3594 TaxID=1427578 RepID=A0AAW9QXV2_9CHRO
MGRAKRNPPKDRRQEAGGRRQEVINYLKDYFLIPIPRTLNPTPYTLHPTPYTLFPNRRESP